MKSKDSEPEKENFKEVDSPSIFCISSKVVRPVQSNIREITKKVKKVEKPHSRNKSKSRLFKLLQIYYRRYLKRYPLVRIIAIKLWSNGYPVYLKAENFFSVLFIRVKMIFLLRSKGALLWQQLQTNLLEKRWRRLIKLQEYIKNENTSSCSLIGGEEVPALDCLVLPKKDKNFLSASYQMHQFPEKVVVTIHDAIVYGGTNLVIKGNDVICHDLFNYKSDYTSEELHGRVLINSKRGKIRWLSYDDNAEEIEKVANFVDACAINYAHWLTEVLPRIVLFCAEKRYNNIPIVVNDGMHQNIMDSLALVAGSDREIIVLPLGRALKVKSLYLTSVAGYVPYGKRGKKIKDHSHGLFSPQALDKMRRFIVSQEHGLEKQEWPENVYLSRASGIRRVINEKEVEALLAAKGFVLVEAEKLNFLEQVQLFKHAKKIISPTGAGLANAIFCEAEAHVTILMGKHEDMIYRYWVNILAPLNLKITYVLGEINSALNMGLHGDYSVDISDLAKALEANNG